MKRIIASVAIIAALSLSIVGLTIAWQHETENRAAFRCIRIIER